MSTAQVVHLQKVVNNITVNGSFRKRWTSVIPLVTVLKVRYKFDDDINFTKENINRAMHHIDVLLNAKNINHLSGIYRVDLGREQFYFFQGPLVESSVFPYFSHNNDTFWNKMCNADKKELENYGRRIDNVYIQDRSAKKRKYNDTDIIITNKNTIKNTEELASIQASRVIFKSPYGFWDSPDATYIFLF